MVSCRVPSRPNLVRAVKAFMVGRSKPTWCIVRRRPPLWRTRGKRRVVWARSWRWRVVEPCDIDRKPIPQSGQSVNFFLKSGLGASAAMVAKPVRAPLWVTRRRRRSQRSKWLWAREARSAHKATSDDPPGINPTTTCDSNRSHSRAR